MLVVLFPLYFIVIASISDPVLVQSGEVLFWPKGITFEGYKMIFQDSSIWRGYGISLWCVVVGTIINLIFTIPAGYALSRKDLPGKKFFMLFLTFTMFFGGGLIPTYLLVKDLGLINSLWSLVLTDAVSVINIIIVRTYFQTNIPEELYEAAQMDGCSEVKTFFKIAIPLAKPIIAIMVLYYGLGQWNQFFKGIIYIQDENLYPLQLVLRNILVQNTSTAGATMNTDTFLAQQRLAELIKYGVIIIGSLPPIIAYPFVQKYFEKGVMVGSVKG
ncbi:ABC transporter permease subunit [Turicibacter sanguinis]|nr:ABC transporter permease subunit [Turicibacter sanguinis]MTH10989.1 ABC transporter permease subunit [Turicibacter sanguinis]MTH13770.1 ABC transporter permease subunit [Turicibacter sanguinis]MTH20844.1 ABC transporter permease subunit [Turicibacter sanguinis]MTH41726.1 ABC transporter permease subunit [Turicibacter sanguinis]